ncbi:MAG: ASCH domain-containing protein [Pseudomonadota bacterium]
MTTLTLALKAEYFDAIASGRKTEEYRLAKPYWQKRLEGVPFRHIVLTKGYPPRRDLSRRMFRPWRGYIRKTITHPHFGPDPVEVFAIRVN